ncbi:MAG: type II toxin-antitoxin system HicB family antitoxin [Planctomycetes bacterium]|nr:type II toxin-antitoxin system HicB family antitoxin [Planctomycetota bacterium]
MKKLYKLPLLLSPQPEGGYTVTCPILPEFLTEGESMEDIIVNVQDALEATLEIYEEFKMPLPECLTQSPDDEPISFEYLLAE